MRSLSNLPVSQPGDYNLHPPTYGTLPHPYWGYGFRPHPPAPLPARPAPHKCPVCEGRGDMPAGFYRRQITSNDTKPEKCKSCYGTGVIR